MAKNNSASNSKTSEWGSDWTIEKLNAFKKYVEAYLTIMEVNKKKYNWKTLYFDGFAGSEDRGENNGSKNTASNTKLFDFGIEKNETEIYKGAAERVLSINKKFDYYYFIDLKEESLKKLREKLSSFNEDYRLVFRGGDANKWLKELAAALKKNRNLRALILLDPFGMQINWESIELLKGTASDIWILIPSGVIINRLLDRRGNLTNINKLCSFFGMTKDEIRKEFYIENVETTLFGEETSIQKKQEPIRKIVDLYIKRLKDIWKNVTPKPLILKNTKNIEIFHFVFASNSTAGLKIANNIIGKV
jgi:three-Cys-motif partner protein